MKRVAVAMCVCLGLVAAVVAPWQFTSATFTATAGSALNFASQASYSCPFDYRAKVMATSGLVNYWRLGEAAGATTAVDETAANNGTYFGSPPGLGTPGAHSSMGGNTALQFAGTQRVDVGSIDTFAGTAAFSIELWVKRTAVLDNYDRLVSTDGGTPREGWLVFMDPAQAGTQYTIGFERWQAGVSSSAHGSTRLSLNTWHHVVATYDGTAMVVYVDGNREATSGSTRTISATARPLRLGAQGVTPGVSFRGAIDEVAVYNRALSGAEVQDHTADCTYASTIARTNGLQSYWRLDDQSTTARDSGSQNNSGTYTSSSMLGAPGALQSTTRPSGAFVAASSQSVNIGNNLYNFAALAPFSVEAWVKLSSTHGSVNRRILSYEGSTGGTQGWILAVQNTTNKIEFDRFLNGAKDSAVSATALPIGTWVHVVATYDGTNMEVFFNGWSSSGPVPSAKSVSSFTASFRIGCASGGGSNFDGNLDEVAVYNAALSPATIAAHYAAR